MSTSYEEIRRLEGQIETVLLGAGLNAWETKFLTAMRDRIQKYGTKARFSARQTQKLEELVSRNRASSYVPSAGAAYRSSPRTKEHGFLTWTAVNLAGEFVRVFAVAMAVAAIVIGFTLMA